LTIHPAASPKAWDSSKTNPLCHREDAVRDGSRYGSAAEQTGRCAGCATPLASARATYCSAACKQRSYRRRQARTARRLPALLTAPTAVLRAHTVYECPSCQERFVGERRCPDCQLFCRSLGLGGTCRHCDEPLLLTELLGQGGDTLLA
jgi:hypothetical protein